MDRRTFVTAAASLLVTEARAAVETDAAGRPLSHPMVGRHVPAFSAEKVGGGAFTDANLNGKWSVLDFWGIWCPDCMVDAPHTEALARAIAQDRRMQLIGVHVDRRTGRWDSVGAYMAEKQITTTTLLDPDKALYRAFEMQWVPTYLVVDPRGVVRGFRTDLSTERASDGGVKTFMQDIARLRGAHR